MTRKTKNTFLIEIAVPNTHNLAKAMIDKQNKYQELANVEAKGKTSDPDSNIIYGSNSKVSIRKSNKIYLTHEYIYTNAEISNSWHMFNRKKLFKLQIRPPSLILLITTSQNR